MGDTYQRIIVIESDESVGQFLEESIETLLGGEDSNVSVRELDPNSVPDRIFNKPKR